MFNRRNFLLAIGLAPFLLIEKPKVERSSSSYCKVRYKSLYYKGLVKINTLCSV